MRISARRRNGFTLVEVMIATAVTLLMLAALAEGFKRIGDAISDNRAALEMSDRLRNLNHRLREDLDGVTVHMRPPLDSQGGLGYFEYYEGPMTDYTAAMFVPPQSMRPGAANPDPFLNVPTARYGDFDDILMFTSQAKGAWYTGKVPRFLIRKNSGLAPDGGNGWTADDFEPVVIASQYAEIAWFVRPQVGTPIDLTLNPVLNLYRRVLLIRPDLNIGGVLPSPPGGAGFGSWMRATNDPIVGMSPIHQQCDLSVRRVPDGDTSTFDPVAANSLQDLMRRENRFAHFVQMGPAGFPNSTSMGLLALESAYPFALEPFTTNLANGQSPATIQPGLSLPSTNLSGPIRSEFLLSDATAINPLYLNRVGEDVVSTFCTSFDIKGFDPEVPIFYLPGRPGSSPLPAWGTPDLDDDLDLTVDNESEAGFANSDDMIVSPNDPAYVLGVVGYATSPRNAIVAGTGEFVDLGWGRHVFNMLSTWGFGESSVPSGANNFNFSTPLSGFSQFNYLLTRSSPNDTPARPFTDALYRSGLVYQPSGSYYSPDAWCQIAYDSGSNEYESDGVIHADIGAHAAGGPYSGTIQINNLYRYNSGLSGDDSSSLPSWKQVADIGADGIDNIGLRNPATYAYAAFGGVDDVDEIETSAPFPVRLRSLQITTRIEDPDTRQLQQAKVQTEFLTH